jgi:hypothetical protein
MNTWNSTKVHALYDSQVLGFLTEIEGKTRLNPTRVANVFRSLVLDEGADPTDMSTLTKAREPSRHTLNPLFPFETINWGCFTMMLSELGKTQQLDDILEYADTHLNPTWEEGGLYYPRNDRLVDAEHNMVHMEPHSGNSGIAYSRLNVPDGQKMMWERPWTRSVLAERPFVDGLGYADGVDVLRGIWDEEARAMVVTLRSWDGRAREVRFSVENLGRGEWAVYVDGGLKEMVTVEGGEGLYVIVSLGEVEVDVVVAPAGGAVAETITSVMT